MILARWTAPQRRNGGGDKLEIDPDGSYRLERFTGITRVGYFAGALSDAELQELNDAIEAAKAEPVDRTAAPMADGGEAVVTGAGYYMPTRGATTQSAQHAVLVLLRRLAMDLTRNPIAAVDVELLPAEQQLLVRHVGSEPLHLERATLSLAPGTGEPHSVEASPDGRIPSDDTAPQADWSTHIALGPEAVGDFQVYADFLLVGSGATRPAQVTINSYAE
jgi:hypothetical protein